MRELSPTLLAAQKSASREPYAFCQYYDGGWQSLSAYVLAYTHVQEDYHSGLSVVINNRTNAFRDLSIRGKTMRIGHGFTTDAGAEYSVAPYLWVHECGPDTQQGHNVVTIKALGVWDKLASSKPSAEITFNDGGDYTTIKGMLSAILNQAGTSLLTSISEDSIVNTRYPKYTLNLNETYADQIIWLLGFTECELVPIAAGLALIHPQDSDPSTYTYDSNHVIAKNTRRVALFKPNKVVVKSLLMPEYGGDGSTVEGSYTDPETGSLVTYEEYFQTTNAWGITSVADCQAQAADLVQRFKRRGNKGWAVTKVNCGQQLWDMVTLVDKWTGQTFSSRVGRIQVDYRAGGAYSMTLGFGAWTLANEATDGEDEAPAATEVIPSISGRMISPYTIEPWLLRKCMQPYTCTVQPDKTNAAYDWNSVVWLAGAINFADGTTQAINAGSYDLPNDDPVLLYFEEGSSTLKHTINWQTAMGWGCGVVAVIQRAESSGGKASWDSANGKSGILNTRLLLADMILAAHIKAGELVLGGKVTGTMDNIGEGASYKRMPTTWISGGKMLLAGMSDGVLAQMFSSSDKASKIQAWCHAADATYIDGGKIYTGSIYADALTIGAGNMLSDPSFERSGQAGAWRGWSEWEGTGWALVNQAAYSHGGTYAPWYAEIANDADESTLQSTRVPCTYGDIFGITAWVRSYGTPSTPLYIRLKWYGNNTGQGDQYLSQSTLTISGAHSSWAPKVLSAAAPAGATFCAVAFYHASAGSSGTSWQVDDVSLGKLSQASRFISSTGAEVQIGPDPSDFTKFGVFGLSSAGVRQFSIEAETGKGVFGGGACTLDATGIHLSESTKQNIPFYEQSYYTGTGSTSGRQITCGFKAKFIWIQSGNYAAGLVTTTRCMFFNAVSGVFANVTAAYLHSSDGFVVGDGDDITGLNINGVRYYYTAFG